MRTQREVPPCSAFRVPRSAFQQGSVLVGILWCLALLSVVVVGVLHSGRLDLMAVKNHGDQIQAHYLALAGIEKAKALLYREAGDRKRSARNHSGDLYDTAPEFKDIPFARGEFRVFRQGRADEGGKIVYGIGDEESRLNVNRASAEELGKLEFMTPEAVAGILDWRDPDDNATPGGAEADYYTSLPAPRLPRNGPLQTVRELLMVNGVSRDLFMGEDANQNGLLDPEEDDGTESFPADNRDGILDPGWAGNLSVHSSVANKNAAGEERINVQSADEKALSSVRGISAELAKAIVAYRGQNQIENLADLLDVAAISPQRTPQPQSGNPGSPAPAGVPRPPGNARAANRTAVQTTGPKLISEELLMEIADDVTVANESDQAGMININTAGAEVLECLPGISKELAQAIISYRQSAGFFANIAGLLKVDGMNREIFKQVAPKVCARSETFRILSEGRITSTGARKRIQVIVRLGSGSIDTLSWREDF
jgi:competence ComEA-like helix-hairpin-helix protein